MTIQHSVIADPEIHEPKGISTASAGQVYAADGVGSGNWITQVSNLTLTPIFSGASTVTQNPTGLDNAYQILFGPAQLTAASPANLTATGEIIFNESGIYQVSFDSYQGRTGGTGVSFLYGRALVNGAQVGPTAHTRLDDSDIVTRVSNQFIRQYTATDTLTFEIYRDSAGNNSGGLIASVPTLAGWTSSVSASIQIDRLQ